MYIQIKNNTLVKWADWEFDGSKFVDVDLCDYTQSPNRYKVENNELIDLSETASYQNKKRIEEIEEELKEIDNLFAQASQTPIEFEGHYYKFEWTSLYQGILNSGILPAKIWDLSELDENAVIMDEEQLQSLQNTLLRVQENAFQTRKSARSLLLQEKENLEKSTED